MGAMATANGSRNTTINHVKCSRQHGGHVHGTSIADKHITGDRWGKQGKWSVLVAPCYNTPQLLYTYTIEFILLEVKLVISPML